MFRITFINVFLSFFLVPLMMHCDDRGGSPCDMYTKFANEKDLITISPTKKVYSQGETIKLKFSLPSKIKIDSKTIDIFQETKQTSAVLSINHYELFKDNTVNYIIGKKIDDNKLSAIYNNLSDRYELEIDVTLNRKDIYSFESSAMFQEREFEEGQCVYVQLATNINGNNIDDGRFEFIVN